MSNLWRNGFDPQKADKGLRGIGLFVILIAFLVASNRFVSGGKTANATSTTPDRPPIVLADAALQPILPRVSSAPRFSYVQPVGGATTPGTSTPAGTSGAGSTPGTSQTGSTPAATVPTAIALTAGDVRGSDVIVTADAATISRIVAAKQCAPAVTIGTDPSTHPARVYRACAVLHGDQVAPSAQTFIGALTSIDGRLVLTDAGFDLPPRQG